MANTSIGNNNRNLTTEISNYGTSNKANLKQYKKEAEQKVKIDFELRKKYMTLYAKQEHETQKQYQERIAKYAQDYEKKKNKLSFETAKKQMEELSEYGQSFGDRMVGSLATAALNATKNAINKIGSSIDEYIGAYSDYYTQIETRLLGSEKSFKSTSNIISNALIGTTAVSQLNVLKKLSEYVDKGIAYNVEQRAFLGTVSEKIATTFDAANGTLLQLIKIQQADTTAARLGLESSLNKFFNSTFKDTSYLNGLSDNVSAAILGANSQLSRDGSVAFEYVVQKWLGSLSSVGVSDSTIQTLAEGLNYLGTGNIAGLASNQSLQTLFALAANNSGLDYSSILTGGLNANTANQLLESIVKYTQGIASTNNQVVKSQYANLFGMTVADLTSILNLSTKDLSSIANNMLSYSDAIKETSQGLNTITNRMTIKDKVENAFQNVLSSIGEGIANNGALYTTYLMTNIVEGFTGGIGIPTIGAMGNFVDLNMSVEQLIKTGIIGVSALSKTGQILSALTGNRRLTLDNWGAEATTGRGRGLNTTLSDTNIGRTVSQTAYIGNTDESALYAGTVTAAQEETKQTVEGNEQAESKAKAEEVQEATLNLDKNVMTILELLQEGLEVKLSNIDTILGGWLGGR